jgi:hypothetical protein
MIRAGLIVNPLSRRNRDGMGGLVEDLPDLLVAAPTSLAELREVLADFARQEVGLVVVSGGDGTVREVLTALVPAYGAALPALAVVPSGNANLIAADVGLSGNSTAGLRQLVEGAREGRLGRFRLRRPLLEVAWPGGQRGPAYGMFMGAAGFTRATQLANAEVHGRGIDHRTGVALSILWAVLRSLGGAQAAHWRRGERLGLSVDETPDPAGPDSHRFLFLATSLHRLFLGLWPFWNVGDAPIRWLDVAAPPRRFTRALLPILRGKPKPWMPDGGYRSGGASRLALSLSGPFVMDGELFPPDPAGPVQVTAGRSVEFVLP